MGDPTLRVALYAAPKPVSSMHAPATFPAGAPINSLMVPITGSGINTGASPPTDIVSLAKTFELQYTASYGCSDPNVIKSVGVTSDYVNRGASPQNTVITFAIEGNGPANTPDFYSSDKEVFFDVNGDGIADYAVYLSSLANGNSNSNAYRAVLVNLGTSVQTVLPVPTNLISPATADTNSYNNGSVLFSINASSLGLAGGGQPTRFTYQVVTFDRNGNVFDVTPGLTYDLAKPGVETESGGTEPFYYADTPPVSIPANYNGVNLQLNNSLGMLTVHRHNGTGLATDVTEIVPPIANLLWRHHDDVNFLWLMNGNVPTLVQLPTVAGANWNVVGLGDIDGDGWRDIIWQDQITGAVFAWLMNGTGIRQDPVSGDPLVVPLGALPGWTIEAVADFNGDGIADILWRHTSGQIYVCYFGAGGSVTSVVSLGAIDPATWRVAGTGDVDGNGTADIVWSYEAPGPAKGTAYAWLMSPAGGIASVQFMGLDAGKLVAKVEDFDGDGRADLLWRDATSGANDIAYATIPPLLEPMPVVPAGWNAAATGDLNSDGRHDIVWFNPGTGQAMAWLMTGAGGVPTSVSLGTVGTTWFLPAQ